MTIINQDRDRAIEVKEGPVFQIRAVFNDGVFYGIDLSVNNQSLGTYDSVEEAAAELVNIESCKYPFYVMGGFAQYETF